MSVELSQDQASAARLGLESLACGHGEYGDSGLQFPLGLDKISPKRSYTDLRAQILEIKSLLSVGNLQRASNTPSSFLGVRGILTPRYLEP